MRWQEASVLDKAAGAAERGVSQACASQASNAVCSILPLLTTAHAAAFFLILFSAPNPVLEIGRAHV